MTNPTQSAPVEKNTPSAVTSASGNKIEAAKVEQAPAKAESEPASKS